jgi:integrase/recombinase XerD
MSHGDSDRETLNSYLDDCRIHGAGVDTCRVRQKVLAKFLRDLPDNRDESAILNIMIQYREQYTFHTFQTLKGIVVPFITATMPGIDTRRIRRVRSAYKPTRRMPSAMLSTHEVGKIIDAARNPRDRALVSVLYEGGFRPVELARLVWSAVNFDDYGATVVTAEKTGKPRQVRLISSAIALKTWQTHHGHVSPDRPVFTSLKTPPDPITSPAIRNLVYRLADRAAIDRKVFPYLFRHSRITHMLSDEIPESVIKLQHWGSLSTNMLATYAHLSTTQTDRVLLRHAGLEENAPAGDTSMRPVKCLHCGTLNEPTHEYCRKCGEPLTEEAKTRRRQEDEAYLETIYQWIQRRHEQEHDMIKPTREDSK